MNDCNILENLNILTFVLEMFEWRQWTEVRLTTCI